MRPRTFAVTACPVGRLWIMPRPRGGEWLDAEWAGLHEAGVRTVVGLLEDSELIDCDLADAVASAERAGLRYLRLPVPDRGTPPDALAARALVGAVVADLRAGRGVAVHCRAGIGRSTMIAACVLRSLGLTVDAAWTALRAARGLEVPDTPAQREWVRVNADE